MSKSIHYIFLWKRTQVEIYQYTVIFSMRILTACNYIPSVVLFCGINIFLFKLHFSNWSNTQISTVGNLRKPRLFSIVLHTKITDFLVNVHLSRTGFETLIQYAEGVTFKWNRKSAPGATVEVTDFVKLFLSVWGEINDRASKGQKIWGTNVGMSWNSNWKVQDLGSILSWHLNIYRLRRLLNQ